MKIRPVRSIVLACLALSGLVSCKSSRPDPEISASDADRLEEPDDRLFEGIDDSREVWSSFQAMIDTVRTDEQLVSVFASAAKSRALEIWEKTSGERWRDLAMATADPRKRELYRVWGATQTRDGLGNFQQLAFEMPPGIHVPFHADTAHLRLRRTRMRLGGDLSMEATDEVDTITIDEGGDHRFHSSRPMERGFWRLTALDVAGFREWFLNVEDLPVRVDPDAEGFQVWTGARSRVHLKSDSVWRVFDLAADSVLRLPVSRDSLRERIIPLVVESEGRFAFRSIQVPARDPVPWLRSATWTQQTAFAPGATVRIHGVLRILGRDGRLSLSGLPPKVGVVVSEDTMEATLDRDGHFRLAYPLSRDAIQGRRDLEVVVPTDWGFPPRPGDSRRDPWWSLEGWAARSGFDVRDGRSVPPPGSEAIRRTRFPDLGARFDKRVYWQGERARLVVRMEDSTGMVARDQVEVLARSTRGEARYKVRLDRGMGDVWIPMDAPGQVEVNVGADRVKGGFRMGAVATVVASEGAHPPREAVLDLRTEAERVLPGSTVRVRVTSLYEGAPVLLLTRGLRLGPCRSGRIREGRFEADIPVEYLGGRWRLEAHLRRADGIRTVVSRLSMADDRRARVAIQASRSGRISLRVSDAAGRGVRANLTVSVTADPSDAPGMEMMPGMDSLPDAPRVWPVFQARALLPWTMKGARLASDAWFPVVAHEDQKPEPWPRKAVVHPAFRPQVTDPDDPAAVHFDRSLSLEEIEALRQPGPPRSRWRGKPLPVAYWAEDLRTGPDGSASLFAGALPADVRWVAVRGTADGGRVVDASQEIR